MAHWTYGLSERVAKSWARVWEEQAERERREEARQRLNVAVGSWWQKHVEGAIFRALTEKPPIPETALEAEVQCAYCKQRRWVGWDIRHDGKNPTAEHHKLARCPNCPTGQDRTTYTGRCRGQVESKRPD